MAPGIAAKAYRLAIDMFHYRLRFLLPRFRQALDYSSAYDIPTEAQSGDRTELMRIEIVWSGITMVIPCSEDPYRWPHWSAHYIVKHSPTCVLYATLGRVITVLVAPNKLDLVEDMESSLPVVSVERESMSASASASASEAPAPTLQRTNIYKNTIARVLVSGVG